MYPLQTERPYALNQWYVAAWSHEVGRTIFERKILGQSLVFYRTQAGKPIAMDNACPHRRYALSNGRLEGDDIECAYHGFKFNGNGKCVHVPQQDKIPAAFVTRTYPLVECWQWVWIWMGDPDKADPSLIPDSKWFKDKEPGWRGFAGAVDLLKARYMLLHENLLDLSHLGFLHARNIGTPRVAQSAVEFEVRSDHMALWRNVNSDEFENQPLGKLMGVKGLVDRVMEQQFFAPNLHITGPAFYSAREGGVNPGQSFGAFRVFHGITPETPTTTHYFWGCSRNFEIEDNELDNIMRKFLRGVVDEDIEASETIERLITTGGTLVPEISAISDGAGLRGRRIMQSLIEKDLG
ncbi:Rieske 2Fe-2S domain-containing protein [Pseudomonas promysalinigenes]|uniref:Rieske 2Fe-2S domain-containing protein n=1 Tax=Pseudomonas promysalinigenes TaxID=485898 RepID=UPI00271AD326